MNKSHNILPPSMKDATKTARLRLAHDFRETLKNPLPLVSAHPVAENLFYWHCNIVAPEGTPFRGINFHLVMVFPMDYPQHPPTIQLCSHIPHPNVFGTRICLDMLETSNEPYEGWTPAYTVQSILIQLQSFLFVQQPDVEPSETRKAIAAAKEFNCPTCEHRHHRFWPALHSIEKADWVIPKSEAETLKEELICFYTKVPYTEKPLGFGVSAKRNGRTQELQSVKSNFDLLSIYAFNNLNVRKAADNHHFTYWMPVWINAEHGAKAYPLAKKAISMIYNDNTRDFQPYMVLEVLPKIMTTLVVDFCKDASHISMKVLKCFCAMHRLLLEFLKEFPELEEIATKKLLGFIQDEAKRHKEVVPSIGEFICLLTVTKIGWDDLKEAYMDETAIRSAFWIINDYPELKKTDPDPEIDHDRADKSFNAGAVGKKLLLFYLHVAENLASPKIGVETICKNYDDRYGSPTEKQLEELSTRIKFVTTNVKNYNEWMKELRMPSLNRDELNDLLRNSIKRSAEKGYHGSRGTGSTKKEYLAGCWKVLNSTLELLQNDDNEGKWRDAYFNDFAVITALAQNQPSWAFVYQTQSLKFYLKYVFHVKGDWKELRHVISRSKAIKTYRFEHTYPSTSVVKEKDSILTNLMLHLPGLEDLTIVATDYTRKYPARMKNFLTSLIKGLKRDSLKRFTYEGFSLSLAQKKKNQPPDSPVGQDSPVRPDSPFGNLASALAKQTNLRYLSFPSCSWIMDNGNDLPADIEGLNALLESPLQELSIQLPLQFMEIYPFHHALERNKTLTTLDLSGTVPQTHLSELFEALPTSLRTLKLRIMCTFNYRVSESVPYQEFLDYLNRSKLESLQFAPNDFFTLNYNQYDAFFKGLAQTPLKTIIFDHRPHPQQPSRDINRPVADPVSMVLASKNLTTLKMTQQTPWNLISKDITGQVSPIEHLECPAQVRNDFFKVLNKFPLKTLILNGFQKTKPLQYFLEDTRSLEELTLNFPSTAREPKDCGEFFNSLGVSQCPLKKLHLQHRKISHLGSVGLANYLSIASTKKFLTSLNIYNAQLGPHGIKLLAEALKGNTTLTSLDIGHNVCKDKGAAFLASFIVSSQLKSLRAKSNFLHEEGVLTILNAVMQQPKLTLTEVYLGKNPGSTYALVTKFLTSFSHKMRTTEEGMDLEEDMSKLALNRKYPTSIFNHFYLDIVSVYTKSDEDHLDRTICISNAPKGVRESEITNLFTGNGCGAIHKTEIRHIKGETSYAFVTFNDPNSVTLAMDFGGAKKAKLRGQILHVHKAGTSQRKRKAPKQKQPKTTAKKRKPGKNAKIEGWN